MRNPNIKNLSGIARINQGDFTVKVLDLGNKTITLYSSYGTQTYQFDSIDGLKLFATNFPMLITPN